MRHARILLAVLVGTVFVAVAAAQDYPARPITLVVPFAPGGGVDQMARLIAGKLEQRLGKSFVIENKPGAGSIIAATYVPGSYADFVKHPKVLKVVALSGGYSREEGNARLSRNHGVVASFSRALLEGLFAQQSDAEFDATLDSAIQSIYEASVIKK